MSGARALAAARNRRAGPTNNTPVPSPSRSINNSSSVPTDLEQNSSAQKKMNPAMMLLSHNKILTNLQSVVEDLNSKIDKQEGSLKENAKVDDTTLEYYKHKITTIESSLEEIKKHTLKVQTFSMETSLQLTEMKKKFNRYEKKEQNDQDKQRDKIIENINKVSTILTKINSELEQNKQTQNIQNSTLVDILQGISNNVSGDTIIHNEVSEENEEEENKPVEEEEEENKPVEEEEEENKPVEEEEEEEEEIRIGMNDEGEDSTQLNF